eukprot:scaffold6912_cov92-Amphora_coffeaeformis.AAC.1
MATHLLKKLWTVFAAFSDIKASLMHFSSQNVLQKDAPSVDSHLIPTRSWCAKCSNLSWQQFPPRTTLKNQSDDEYLEDYLEEYESDMKGEMCETMDEWYMNKQKSESHDPNYEEGPEELFAIMKHMVQKDAAHAPSLPRNGKNGGRKKPPPQRQNPQPGGEDGDGKRKDILLTTETSEIANAEKPAEVVGNESHNMEASEKKTTPDDEISIFDPSKCIDPINEWLVLELPYLSLQEENSVHVPSLVPWPVFVPEGSREVSLVIFIRVKHCFVKVCLSVIGYTRKQAGNYFDKTSSYVTTFGDSDKI